MQDQTSTLFLVKVRVDVSKMGAFRRRLESGALDRSAIRGTYCLREDPAVGLGIWQTAGRQELEAKLAPWREFYASVEVQPVVTPAEAMLLLAQSGPQAGEAR